MDCTEVAERKLFQLRVGRAKSSEAAKKLLTLIQLTGVQGLADHKLSVLPRIWACW